MTAKIFHVAYPAQICKMHVAHSQFSKKLKNG